MSSSIPSLIERKLDKISNDVIECKTQEKYDEYCALVGEYFSSINSVIDTNKKNDMKKKLSNHISLLESLKGMCCNTKQLPPTIQSSSSSSSSLKASAPTAPTASQVPKDARDFTVSFSKGKEDNKKRNYSGLNSSNNTISNTTTTPKSSSKHPVPKASSSHTKSSSASAGKKDSTTSNSTNTETGTGSGAAAELNEYEKVMVGDMLDSNPKIQFSDIAGLTSAKQTLYEAVILPNLRRDLFTGLRKPPKGVLLFGPPGTGKTLLAKAVATESKFSFFCVSSSTVASKFHGEGEKLMKALFTSARKMNPSVIFFDEIDSLMSARSDNEHEASRKVKTEFMTQMDGASTGNDDSERLLVMAATNIPWSLDEAVLRRLSKRIYIPLPDKESRLYLITHMLKKQYSSSSNSGGGSGDDGGCVVDLGIGATSLNNIVELTEGYSASDLTNLCIEASMVPLRELKASEIETVRACDIRKLNENDFVLTTKIIRPSVVQANIQKLNDWSDAYGMK